METNPTRMCELLVGLSEVSVLGVIDDPGGPVVVAVETRAEIPACERCGARADLKDRDPVDHVDLACSAGRCGCNAVCSVGSWTETNDELAVPDRQVTTRSARWVTR